ncbi:HTH-type transcriptional activator CmpR [Clostridium homopropionicum DSM 5847]|uniref:HTH-type transcriptional activator CmpR n=1 Tax=Clostridium homopropionicum DSM 5847 TaxID=1121318 RepID=A0A0L6ZAV3_9CLOT|nr:LysR family transcriptional regulator [Clostridium homopropionicum]KOA20104.1 HTH-type transcriptional activator CmpR [Clostridium homopropionicum DSM 5847]SFG98825.1 DNA-binding transcriptional regulator, LysR family [Clostridium homopropionicum]
MGVSFDAYRVFYYVAKYKNITNASKALCVTQPTVTYTIKTLERELGCTLFLRSQKGVTLTPEAKMLYEHVSIACKHIFEAEANINSAKKLAKGQVTIGASETSIHLMLLPYLKKFREDNPDIKLKVTNSTTPATIASLRSGLIDFAILVMSPSEKEPDLSITELLDFQDIFIAGSDFSELLASEVSLNDLTKYPIVCMEPGTITRQFLDEFFLKHNLSLNPDIELATSDLITPMVENNLGIGFVPYEFAKASLEKKSVFRVNLKEEIPKRTICAISRTSHPLSIASEEFLKMLCEKRNKEL